MAWSQRTLGRIAVLLLLCAIYYLLDISFLSLGWRANQLQARRLSVKLRHYDSMSKRLDAGKTSAQELMRNFSRLEHSLFPFLKQDAKSFRNSFSGRGIVVAASSKFLPFVKLLIKNLRLVGNTLPIELMYKGERELSESERSLLISLNVKPIDILTLMDDSQVRLSGFAMKPFALCFSSFRETILVDADTLFFHAPELLFNDEGYNKTGTLFFLDRYWRRQGERMIGPSWFDNNMPQPISERLKRSQIYRGMSNNLIEAGVVVVDKYRNFHGVLAACRLLMKEERDGWFYKAFWGDKEAFWLAFELLGQDYAIHPQRPGILGHLHSNRNSGEQEVCGNVVHPGIDGRPFWWNGGVVAKYIQSDDAIKFEAFALEGAVDTGRPVDSCLEKVPPRMLTVDERNLVSVLREDWQSNSGSVRSFCGYSLCLILMTFVNNAYIS